MSADLTLMLSTMSSLPLELTVPEVFFLLDLGQAACIATGDIENDQAKVPLYKRKRSHVAPRSLDPRAPCVSRLIFGSAKTDPVQFKWGFGEGLWKDKFAFFEASKNPIPKRRKLPAKRLFL